MKTVAKFVVSVALIVFWAYMFAGTV